jgi:hypothetical protein
MCACTDVTKLLGTVKTIVAEDPKVFAREISQFTGVNDHQTGTERVAEMWPLIRQAKIKCRSAALSSGAILVDLPGVADGNVARGDIAKRYMEKCKFFWIVAPITRAVDDRIAKGTLMNREI